MVYSIIQTDLKLNRIIHIQSINMSLQNKKRQLELAERKHIVRSSVLYSCGRSRRQKKEDLSIPYLPSEIIFNILSRLPAEFLQDKGKYVCKTWAKIISDPTFVETHLLHSNAGFLIQYRKTLLKTNMLKCLRFVEAKEGKISVTRKKKYSFPFERILTSCAGVLLFKLSHFGRFNVANCITKQWLKLPCFESKNCQEIHTADCGVAYVPQTRESKVVVPCSGYGEERGHLHVVTVGGGANDGSWRKIDSGRKRSEFCSLFDRPVSVNGIIYWVSDDIGKDTFAYVDLRDEVFRFLNVPEEFLNLEDARHLRRTYGFQKMGNNLSCIVRGKNEMEINVWILKNSRSSEWEKIGKIEYKVGLKEAIWDGWKYMPIVWLQNGRILLFVDSSISPTKLIVYNLSTGAMRILKNIHEVNLVYSFEHTKSLVSW